MATILNGQFSNHWDYYSYNPMETYLDFECLVIWSLIEYCFQLERKYNFLPFQQTRAQIRFFRWSTYERRKLSTFKTSRKYSNYQIANETSVGAWILNKGILNTLEYRMFLSSDFQLFGFGMVGYNNSYSYGPDHSKTKPLEIRKKWRPFCSDFQWFWTNWPPFCSDFQWF